MLDVHPPHTPTHSWKDFFIHVGTICVGLLIAVGLEQTVERIHQHYELRELRESLRQENEANRDMIQFDIRSWRWEVAELENDLLVLHYLQQHPGTAQGDLPGDLFFIQSPVISESGVWDAAARKGSVNLLPVAEANRNSNMYTFLKILGEQGLAEYVAFNDAGRFTASDGNPAHLSAAQLESTIQLVELAIEKHVLVGNSLALLSSAFPQLGSTLTNEEVSKAQHQAIRESPQELAHAHQLTVDRLTTAGFPKAYLHFISPPAKQ